MKLAIFLQDLNSGGAEKIMVQFANYLASVENDEVYLIVVRNVGAYKNLVSDKVKVIDLNKSKTLFSFVSLAKTLKSIKPDVIYTTLVNANVLVLLVGRLLNQKVIIREANTISNNRTNEKRLLIKFAHLMSKYVYKWCYKCIAISNAVKADLINFTNCESSKISVIYNPIVSIDNLNVQLEKDNFHIGIVCRLAPQKNIDTVIEIMRSCFEKRIKVIFHFFGEGDDSKILELINNYNAKDRIIMHGFEISYLSYLKHMGLFLHIPLWEGLGNSVLEAYNSGIPMILSNVRSGYSEIIPKNSPNVHYIDPTDKDSSVSIIEAYSKNDVSLQPRETLKIEQSEIYKKYRDLAFQ